MSFNITSSYLLFEFVKRFTATKVTAYDDFQKGKLLGVSGDCTQMTFFSKKIDAFRFKLAQNFFFKID